MEWWQDPAFLTQLLALLTILGVLVGALLFLWRWARSHDRLHRSIEDLPTKVDDLTAKVSTLLVIEADRTPNLWDKVKAFSPLKPNPYDPARKSKLLDQMRAGTISLDEAQELREILNEDIGRARSGGAADGAGSLLALLAILGALGALIYLLTRKDL